MSMIFMRTQALHVHDFVFTSKQLLVWVKVRCTFHIHNPKDNPIKSKSFR